MTMPPANQAPRAVSGTPASPGVLSVAPLDDAAVEAAESPGWDRQLAGLLGDLSDLQAELLNLLEAKRHLLRQVDTAALEAANAREGELITRLGELHARRGRLLAEAQASQLPCDSLQALCAHLPLPGRRPLARQLEAASRQMRLLQHHSLTNWVVVQRTLLHLAQLLEIIARGGRPRPTYGEEPSAANCGALLNQEI